MKKEVSKTLVTKDTNLGELVLKHPEAAEVL